MQTIHFSDQFRQQRSESTPESSASSAATAAAAAKTRSVYHADFKAELPGRLVRQEGEPATNDLAIDEAYDGAGATFDLFWEVYQRNSIDGSGVR